jgi:hypothetical protein
LRRYGIMRSLAASRTLVTEGIVVVGDAALNRDLNALRGRIAGWRSAKGLPLSPRPPEEALDETISLFESMRLRRVAYAG